MDKAGCTLRFKFSNFLNKFNTIQLLLTGVHVDITTISCIREYLTSRPRFVYRKKYMSDQVVCGTGSPQGMALSHFFI